MIKHKTHELVKCGTGRRKLMVWEIGVEGDKFNPHLWNADCDRAGCVPLDSREFAQIAAHELRSVDNVVTIADKLLMFLSYENMRV